MLVSCKKGGVLALQLLGLQSDLGPEHFPGHLSPLCEDGREALPT
jgi:hypothetical protein